MVTFSKLERAGISKEGTSRLTLTREVTLSIALTAFWMTVLAFPICVWMRVRISLRDASTALEIYERYKGC